MIERVPFPEVVDNTILNTFRACPRKAYLNYVEHWKPKGTNVHLHAGAAYARGIECARRAFYEQGRSPEDSLAIGLHGLLESYGSYEAPAESAKSAVRMAQALEYTLSGDWALGVDRAVPAKFHTGRPAVEFSFAEPLPVSHPETGNPIIFCGRSDMICQLAQGLFIEDDKTTGQMGPKWSNQWDMRAQFSGYVWAARHGAARIEVDGVLVRGIAILKTEFKRGQYITYRPEWRIREWLDQTVRDLERMIQAWKTGIWDLNMGDTCDAYGGCSFLQMCQRFNREEWMGDYFERRIWDPLHRIETKLES